MAPDRAPMGPSRPSCRRRSPCGCGTLPGRHAALEAFRNRKDYAVVVMDANVSYRRTIRRHVANAYGVGWQPLPR